MTKKILITGGTGFIGSHLAEKCVSKGYKVTVFDRYNPNYNLGNLAQSRAIWVDDKPDTTYKIDCTSRIFKEKLALKGITTVIDCAIIRSTSSYTSETIDWRGKLALIEAALE